MRQLHGQGLFGQGLMVGCVPHGETRAHSMRVRGAGGRVVMPAGIGAGSGAGSGAGVARFMMQHHSQQPSPFDDHMQSMFEELHLFDYEADAVLSHSNVANTLQDIGYQMGQVRACLFFRARSLQSKGRVTCELANLCGTALCFVDQSFALLTIVSAGSVCLWHCPRHGPDQQRCARAHLYICVCVCACVRVCLFSGRAKGLSAGESIEAKLALVSTVKIASHPLLYVPTLHQTSDASCHPIV